MLLQLSALSIALNSSQREHKLSRQLFLKAHADLIMSTGTASCWSTYGTLTASNIWDCMPEKLVDGKLDASSSCLTRDGTHPPPAHLLPSGNLSWHLSGFEKEASLSASPF
jgi:hypothetical protein